MGEIRDRPESVTVKVVGGFGCVLPPGEARQIARLLAAADLSPRLCQLLLSDAERAEQWRRSEAAGEVQYR